MAMASSATTQMATTMPTMVPVWVPLSEEDSLPRRSPVGSAELESDDSWDSKEDNELFSHC